MVTSDVHVAKGIGQSSSYYLSSLSMCVCLSLSETFQRYFSLLCLKVCAVYVFKCVCSGKCARWVYTDEDTRGAPEFPLSVLLNCSLLLRQDLSV